MRSRRKRAVPESDQTGIDLTPLLDVVFIMLIFFIVTAAFTRESGIEISKPKASTSNQLEGQSIVITIDKENQIWLENRNIDIRAVQNHISRIQSDNPKASIIIGADKQSLTEVLIAVMDASRRAGVTNISIASEIR